MIFSGHWLAAVNGAPRFAFEAGTPQWEESRHPREKTGRFTHANVGGQSREVRKGAGGRWEHRAPGAAGWTRSNDAEHQEIHGQALQHFNNAVDSAAQGLLKGQNIWGAAERHGIDPRRHPEHAGFVQAVQKRAANLKEQAERTKAPEPPKPAEAKPAPEAPKPPAAKPATKPLADMTGDELKAHIDAQPNNLYATTEEIDWGPRQRGQGRRFGTMVRGAMSDAPVGKKQYARPFGKLPEAERSEANGLPDHVKPDYARARAAGLDHEQAMIWTYELTQEAKPGTTLARIKGTSAKEPEKPAPKRQRSLFGDDDEPEPKVDPSVQGATAHRSGKTRDSNPHAKGSADHGKWDEAFMESHRQKLLDMARAHDAAKAGYTITDATPLSMMSDDQLKDAWQTADAARDFDRTKKIADERRSRPAPEGSENRHKEYLGAIDELDKLEGGWGGLNYHEFRGRGMDQPEQHAVTMAHLNARLGESQKRRADQNEFSAADKALGDFVKFKGVVYQRKKEPRGTEWAPIPGEHGYQIPHDKMVQAGRDKSATPMGREEVKAHIDKKIEHVKSLMTAEQRRKVESLQSQADAELKKPKTVIVDNPPPGGWKPEDKVPEDQHRLAHQEAEAKHGPAWQYTKAKWRELVGAEYETGMWVPEYERAVSRAIRAGENVPDAVLDQANNQNVKIFRLDRRLQEIHNEFTPEQHELMRKKTTELTEGDYLKREETARLRREKVNLVNYQAQRDALGPKQKKEREKLDGWIASTEHVIGKIQSGEFFHGAREHSRQKYREEVKSGISKGLVTDPAIISQYPEFKLARDARERYEKGLHTSFANRSIAVDDSMKATRGYKAKRQDGKAMTPRHAAELAKGVDEIEAAVGTLKDLFDYTDVTLAHTNGKHPFLSTTAGVYHSADRTVTSGVNNFLGMPIKSLAHEIGHWLDFESGRAMGYSDRTTYYTPGARSGRAMNTTAISDFDKDYKNANHPDRSRLIELAKDSMTGERSARQLVKKNLKDAGSDEERAEIEDAKVTLGSYFTQPVEIWARLFEQYVGDHHSDNPANVSHKSSYHKRVAYWDKESWAVLKPLVKKEIDRRICLIRAAAQKGAK